jgi:rhamnosyl/mannosyltransferase
MASIPVFKYQPKRTASGSQRTTIRICHLSKYYPPEPGGIETHVRVLAQAQAQMGAEVDVICVNTRSAAGDASVQTPTVVVQDGAVRVIRLGRMMHLSRLDVFTDFSRYFDRDYDVAHLHTPNPAMALHWSMSNHKAPLIVTHHSDIVRQKTLRYLVNPLMHSVYRQATQILTASPTYLAGSNFLRHHEDRVEMLAYGLDLSIYQQPSATAIAYAKTLKANYPGPLWLSVGRLVYYKALHIAIAALQWVPGTLIIVGQGKLADALKRQAAELGVSDRIVWLAYLNQDQLVGAYHAATALWFPSNARSEAFGLVQVEAMASGCPVINADIPHSGVTWVSRHGQEGLTVPLNNATALAAAANSLLMQPQLYAQLVRASRARSLRFDHLCMGRESLAIYRQAIAQATVPYLSP